MVGWVVTSDLRSVAEPRVTMGDAIETAAETSSVLRRDTEVVDVQRVR